MNRKETGHKDLFICLILIGLIFCWCNKLCAYVVNKTQTGAEIQWASSEVIYFLNPSGGPGGSLSAVQAAAQTWTNVQSSSFVFLYGGTTTSTAYGINDGINTIGFGSLEDGALAQNTFWYKANSGEILDSDIRFDSANSWNTNGSNNGFDVQNVCTHELGHSLSLADLYDPMDSEKTMYGHVLAGETKKRTLDPDDAAGISYLYPAVGEEYALVVHTQGQGSVTLDPAGGIYDEGTTVAVTAVADIGWIFTEWSGDLSGSMNPETIIMDSNKDITAIFDPALQYTLTIETVGQGSVTLDPDGEIYNAGTLVALTATADPSWVFGEWSGDLTGSRNPETIIMDDDKQITATFDPGLQYTLTVETAGAGSVTLVPDGGVYEAGTVVQLTAEPGAILGREVIFTGWGGDLHGSLNPTTVTMDSDKAITATFIEVAVEHGQLTHIGYVDPTGIENAPGKPDMFPYGLMELVIQTNIAGETALVTVYLPNPAPTTYRWYKYI